MECNPEDVTSSFVENMMQLGVNRFSLGLQSFNEEECLFLGRGHGVKENYQALECFANADCNVSVDLIFGLPDSTLKQLKFSWRSVEIFSCTYINIWVNYRA